MKNPVNAFVNRFRPAPYATGRQAERVNRVTEQQRVEVRHVRRDEHDRAGACRRAQRVQLALDQHAILHVEHAPARVAAMQQCGEPGRQHAGGEAVDAAVEVARDLGRVAARRRR